MHLFFPTLPRSSFSSPFAPLSKTSLSLHSCSPWHPQTIMESFAACGTIRHSLEVKVCSRSGLIPSSGRFGWWHIVYTVIVLFAFLLEEQTKNLETLESNACDWLYLKRSLHPADVREMRHHLSSLTLSRFRLHAHLACEQPRIASQSWRSTLLCALPFITFIHLSLKPFIQSSRQHWLRTVTRLARRLADQQPVEDVPSPSHYGLDKQKKVDGSSALLLPLLLNMLMCNCPKRKCTPSSSTYPVQPGLGRFPAGKRYSTPRMSWEFAAGLIQRDRQYSN